MGGGPAGLATARAYRDRGGSGAVTLVGEEPTLPYERPALTKAFLRGRVEVEELALESGSWFEEHDVELCLGVGARAIEPARGAVALTDGRELRGEAIVIATGSEPVRPPLPGAEHSNVQVMRRLTDSMHLASHRALGHDVTVIGSGFIGCEIAGSLACEGVRVTLVSEESAPQAERLGEPVGERLAGWLGDLGVVLVMGASVEAIHDGNVVELADGRRISAEHTVLATGVRPRGELAREAGLATRDGAVRVGANMRSSDPRVLAVGDVALAHSALAGRALRVEHWGDALAHGEVAGATLAGTDIEWDTVPGFWSTIGERTVKYAAWGDGYEEERIVDHDGGGFTAWYLRGGATVGVLTHECDRDYERGRELVATREPPA